MRITRLDLSKNQLKFLTDDFGSLINLKHLDLYNNQLESLPVTFGKLSKLRYLDLKGNPLQPALQKVIGPCLTSKDCLDAAKNIVPFMSDLEVKVKAEQMRKEEEERKRAEEEEMQAREDTRLAKKAARKERVMKERQEKAEAVKLLMDPKTETNEMEDSLERRQESQESFSFLNFKTLLKALVLILLISSFILISIFPHNGKSYLQLIPDKARFVVESLSKSVSSAYKVLSL